MEVEGLRTAGNSVIFCFDTDDDAIGARVRLYQGQASVIQEHNGSALTPVARPAIPQMDDLGMPANYAATIVRMERISGVTEYFMLFEINGSVVDRYPLTSMTAGATRLFLATTGGTPTAIRTTSFSRFAISYEYLPEEL